MKRPINPSQKILNEIEARKEAMRKDVESIPRCPRCENEKTRCVDHDDKKTILMMECPECHNAWMHKE
jgi:hypothetical protein